MMVSDHNDKSSSKLSCSLALILIMSLQPSWSGNLMIMFAGSFEDILLGGLV